MKFDRIDWNRAFFKTYFEKRSAGHLIINFNRVWVIHIAVFWFYTARNSPTVYRRSNHDDPTSAMQWSASALGGAVATLIMIFATLAEFSYIPTTWNNTSHLTRRLLFLLVALAVTTAPTFYIFLTDNPKSKSNIPLIVALVQFFISVVLTLLFAMVPSGRMFGDRVAGKSRKYLASQTFTASYPDLDRKSRIASIGLWVLIFGCKFTESYFFLTSSFASPIRVMAGTKVRRCSDRWFGDSLCTNQVIFSLTIMYLMDLTLFFLDTFLWYVIWNTVFSIGRSFSLGLSIWTPWKDIFTRLPKRIYAKLLATGDMEVKYKPKVCLNTHPRIKTDLYSRFWSRRSGTPSSSRCTVSISCPSSTSRSCFTTKCNLIKMGAARFEHHPSSSPRVTRACLANSSPKDPRQKGVSLSSPSPSPP